MNLSCLRKDSDIRAILDHYEIQGDLRKCAEYLVEVRNEIIHPTHISLDTLDNWPEYLRFVKESGLLNTTGKENSDYDFFHQLNSHKLLEWAMTISWDVSRKILEQYIETVESSACKVFLKNFGF